MAAGSACAGEPAVLVGTSRRLYLRGWLDGTSGNLSARLDDGSVLVTATGRSKGDLTPDDLVRVDPDSGRPLPGERQRPSAETAVHLALYRGDPRCRAVVHAHMPYATALASRAARAGRTDVRFADYEMIKGLHAADPGAATVPVFANHADVARLAADVTAHLARGPITGPTALLVAYHGATAWGHDAEEAVNLLECLEALCRLSLLDGPSSPLLEVP